MKNVFITGTFGGCYVTMLRATSYGNLAQYFSASSCTLLTPSEKIMRLFRISV